MDTYIIAEIGINHNGEIDLAKELIARAAYYGCDAVKFQKRTPEICVPDDQKDVIRATPWGQITYLDYKHRIEFGQDEYEAIDHFCRAKGIDWFASCWDIPSVDFISQFNVPYFKIASAGLTDLDLLLRHCETGRTTILSTGMSTEEQIRAAINIVGVENPLILMHCNSSYPCSDLEINLNTIQTLKDKFGMPVGYSGHEKGITPSVAAVALGACMIERHITLDKTMWGSDHQSSLSMTELQKMVIEIRRVEKCLGDGAITLYDSEKESMKKLRSQDTLPYLKKK